MTTPYDDMHYQEVKKLVEANGGEWTNKEEGIKYLLGKLEESDSAPAEEDKPEETGGMTWASQDTPPEEPPAPEAKDEGVDISAEGFDPNAPYGTVHGTVAACYYQNGKYYTANGKVVDPTDI